MPLSADAIRKRVGDTSFSKGQAYHARGAVFDTACEENGPLRAKCRGSRSSAYEQEVRLDGARIVDASCTCPVGGAGTCKHVAAVLLAWLETPEAFRPESPVDDRLASLNEEQLREALQLLLDRDRDLAWVLDAVGEPDAAGDAGPDPAAYHARAIDRMPAEYGWRGTSGAAHAVGEVASMGEDFLAKGRLEHAAAAFAGAVRAAVETYQNYHDEGEISGEIIRCTHGLGNCMKALPHEAAGRKMAIDALAVVAEFDAEMGGFGLSDDIPGILTQHATPAERKALAQRFRKRLAKLGEDSEWERRSVGALIAEMELDTLDDEGFIKLCRETGRTSDLVDRLLALKRYDKADREAREQQEDYDLLALANVYARHRRTNAFAELLSARVDSTKDPRVWEWLRSHWTKRRKLPQALDMARREFRARPTQTTFDTCLELGRQCSQDLDAELLAWLRDGKHFDTLLDILMKREKYDEAAEVFKLRGKRPSWGFYGGDLELAGRFAAHRPDVAIAIYKDEGKRAIGQRGRSSYAHGCGCLRKWREACRTPADRKAFNAYLRELAVEAKGLPALRDEMGKARVVPFAED